MIRWILAKMLVSAVALWVADALLSGFAVTGGLAGYLIAGAALGLLNALVRPILKLLTFPLILLTFGLFTVVINATLLWTAAQWTGSIAIAGLATLLWATFIISLIQTLLRKH